MLVRFIPFYTSFLINYFLIIRVTKLELPRFIIKAPMTSYH